MNCEEGCGVDYARRYVSYEYNVLWYLSQLLMSYHTTFIHLNLDSCPLNTCFLNLTRLCLSSHVC